MLRQHWDEMVNGNAKALHWLLRKVIAENNAVLKAAPARPSVVINGILISSAGTGARAAGVQHGEQSCRERKWTAYRHAYALVH